MLLYRIYSQKSPLQILPWEGMRKSRCRALSLFVVFA